MDQVFTLSGAKHIALRHRVVRLRLAVWHRVLHWPIFNNENATIAECCTTSDAHGQRRLWVNRYRSFAAEPDAKSALTQKLT
jgi:hypothetical protein